jgi:hypothetical protein
MFFLSAWTMGVALTAVSATHGFGEGAVQSVQFVKAVFTMGLNAELKDDRFFSEENLKSRFHAQYITAWNFGVDQRFALGGVPTFSDQSGLRVPARTEIGIIRENARYVTINVDFIGGIPSANLRSVTQALGSNWQEDEATEEKIFSAKLREPFRASPHAPRIIVYGCANAGNTECRLSLNFGSDDKLANLKLETSFPEGAKRQRGTGSGPSQGPLWVEGGP